MRRRLRGDDGAAALEFTLVAPVLLLLFGFVLSLGLHITYGAVAERAARDGLRQATVRTAVGYGDLAAVRTRVNSTAPGFLPAAQSVTCRVGTGTAPCVAGQRRSLQGEQITVSVTYRVPGVAAALAAIPFVGNSLDGLVTVERVAVGRRE